MKRFKYIIVFIFLLILSYLVVFSNPVILSYNLKKGDGFSYTVDITKIIEGKKLSSTYNYNLKILDIKDDKYLAEMQINSNKYKFSFDKYGNIIDKNLNANLIIYPKKSVDVGDTWDIKSEYVAKTSNNVNLNTKIEGKATLKELKDNIAVIEEVFTINQIGEGFKVEGKGTSIKKININTGFVLEAKTKMDLNIPFDMQRGRKKRQDIKVEINVSQNT